MDLVKVIANAFAAGAVIIVFFRMVQVILLKWIEKISPEIREAKEKLIELCNKIDNNTAAVNQLANHMSDFIDVVRSWQDSQSLIMRFLMQRSIDDSDEDKDSTK